MLRIASLFIFICLLLPLPLRAAAGDPLSAAKGALILDYPNLVVKRIAPTPIEGVFEVISQEGGILYFAPQTGHVLIGELWSKDGRNLTRESMDQLMSEKTSLFPLDKALKIGSGANQVIEVSDPDCPFCRDGSAFFAGRKDVTRYIFLFPLAKIHPEAERKARYILSAENPADAYEEVFSGAFDNQPLPEFKDNGHLDVQRQIVQQIGVTSTPCYWINGHFVSGNNMQKFEDFLDRK